MKKYDIVAVTGEYTNQQGEAKKKYLNVGAVIDTGNGPFIVLEKWFNPGALAEQGRDSVILSLYAPKQKDNGFQQQPQQPNVQTQNTGAPLDQDIPF